MTEPVRYGKWEVVEFIDQGGQGQVYRVRDASDTPHRSERRKVLQKAITLFSGISGESDQENAASLFADEVRQIMAESEAPKGALKKLLPIAEGAAEDEAAAHERMKRELSTLESVDHPALVKVLDRNLDEKWFVMEFLEGGTLTDSFRQIQGARTARAYGSQANSGSCLCAPRQEGCSPRYQAGQHICRAGRTSGAG